MKINLLVLILWPFAVSAVEPLTSAPDAALSHLSLVDAEQMWQRNNREVQLANDQMKGAAADKLAARQRPNPQLSLNSGALNSASDAPPVNHALALADVTLRLDQTFERGDKRELRMRTTDLRFNAARQDLADVRRQGRIALSQAYYDVLLTQEKLRVAEDNKRLFGQTVDASKRRLGAGDIAASEFSRIRVDALRAENDVRQVQNDLRQMQVALAYQIGAERAAESIHAADPWPAVQPLTAYPDAIETRPDIHAAMARVEAAESARDLARALQTRDVTVGFQIERNGGNPPLHSVGFGISIPLLTGYAFQGEIARAEADLQTARDTLDQIKALAAGGIDRSRSNLESASERVQRFDEQLLSEASRTLDSAEFAYRHGALSVMDLLDARRTHKAVQMDAATARADYAKALVAWRFANGEGEPSQ